MFSIFLAFAIAAPVPAEDWTPRTFKVAKPKGAGQGAAAVAVSADGKLVAAAFNGGGPGAGGTRATVRVWEVETGKQVMSVGTQGLVLKVAFGPDGKSVVWGRMHSFDDRLDRSVFVRGFGDKPLTRSYDCWQGAAFAISGDAKRIAVNVADRVEVYDFANDKKLVELKPLPRGFGLAFTPDGKQLAGVRIVTGEEFYLVRCDAATGKLVSESEKLIDAVYHVAVSPDGKQAATGHVYGAVRIWDENWKALRTFATKTEDRVYPFFSPDGKFLAAGGQTDGEVVVWDRESGKEVRRFVFEAGGQGGLPLFLNGNFVPEREPVRFAFTPGSKTLLVGCNGVQLVSLAGGGVIRTFNVE